VTEDVFTKTFQPPPLTQPPKAQDQTVTIRERDAMTQERVASDRLVEYLRERLSR
jgi:glycyl-tRNA synthetase (class II)